MSAEGARKGPRWAVLLGSCGLGMFCLGALVARAASDLVTPGVAGGATRGALSFAGTLKGVSGRQPMTFTFKKKGQPVPGCAPQIGVEPDESGAFAVEIPLDACPSTLFDGADVTVDVTVAGRPVAMDQAISPVPYAKYA